MKVLTSTHANARIMMALCVGLLVTTGCKSAAKPKPEGEVTQSETQVENTPPPEASELMGEAPEPQEQLPDESEVGEGGVASSESPAPQDEIAPIDPGVESRVKSAL